MFGETKYVTMEQLWTWVNLDGVEVSGDLYLGAERCLDFEKYIWFELGKRAWKKHWSVFQVHVKYIHNGIVKHFRVGILQYDNCAREMRNLEKYFPPPPMKWVGFKEDGWDIRGKEFNKDIIQVSTKYGILTYMQDESEDNQEDHRLITHK